MPDSNKDPTDRIASALWFGAWAVWALVGFEVVQWLWNFGWIR
mgnify:CR=1 FL=1